MSDSSSQPPPLPGGPNSSSASQNVSSVVDTAGLFARRILKSNLHSEKVSQHEAEILEKVTPPVTSAVAQSYLGWRRALLWFGGIFEADPKVRPLES
ncbi:MAG: hypothetical protein PVJ98_09685 [Akkermansiaceae bacterium]